MARKRYSAEERAALLEQLSNREESLAGFVRAHGVSVATLYHWQRQAGTSEPVRTDHFTEIRRTDPELVLILQGIAQGSIQRRKHYTGP